MSDQRRDRIEMRQGFYQFMMHMYQSYLQSNSEEKAKEIVAECIKELLDELIAGDFSLTTECVRIKERLAILKKELAASNDYDTQTYIAEKIDTLEDALEIMSN